MDGSGRPAEFVPPGLTVLWAPLGMRVDPGRRVLWVAAAAVPQTVGYDWRFPLPADGRPPTLGDVTIARSGDVSTTDSRGPGVYRVRAGSDSIEQFVTSPLLLSAQGLALDAEERTLYVADYSRGILRIDLAIRTVRVLETAFDSPAGRN